MLICYDPTVPPGTSTTRPDGADLRYVSPEEYYVALLGDRMNATLVFLSANIPGKVAADRMPGVDDAVAEAYWGTYHGCLTPPRVLDVVRRAAVGPSGQIMVDGLESARREVFAAPTLDDAVEVHAACRLQLLLQGAEGFLTDGQVAVGELMTDYLLLQRAIAEDVRRAERERKRGETRAAVLERMDRAAELEFEKMIGLVLRPQRLVEMLPKNRRADLEEFARRRKPIFREGVFANLAELGGGDADDTGW